MSISSLFLEGYDFDKQTELIALDLIYLSSGYKIPLSKIKFGKPRIMVTRPDKVDYPNTFVSANVNKNFDYRLGLNSGFLYLRLGLDFLKPEDEHDKIIPPQYPFKVSDVLDQINVILRAQLTVNDILDLTYAGDENEIELVANPDSLVWVDTKVMKIQSSIIPPILTDLNLSGFTVYTP